MVSSLLCILHYIVITIMTYVWSNLTKFFVSLSNKTPNDCDDLCCCTDGNMPELVQVEDLSIHSVPEAAHNNRRLRRVHFAENTNEYHEMNQTWQERVDQWYSNKEIAAFRQETQQDMKTLRVAEQLSDDPNFWTKALARTYCAYLKGDGAEKDIDKSLRLLLVQQQQGSTAILQEKVFGLEVCSVPVILHDRRERRKRLLAALRVGQERTASLDANQRADILRQLSLSQSQVAVRYAEHVAATQHYLLDSALDDRRSTCVAACSA